MSEITSERIDTQVKSLVDKAYNEEELTCEQLAFLLDLPYNTPSGEYVMAQADEMSRQAAKGRGFIHAQIGLDHLPCPENCQYCSHAACNQALFHSAEELKDKEASLVDLDDVVSTARVFNEGGAHLISLMATAAYPFSLLEEAVSRVHEAAPNVAVMVNCADMDVAQARRLHEAGAQVAYHALRLREGVVTSISPERRLATMRAIQDAGLQFMTGIEPLFAEATGAEIAQVMCELRQFSPYCTGVCKLTKSKEARCELSSVEKERVHYVACVLRLAFGRRVPVGCAGGAIWVDAGTDPRGRGYATDNDSLRQKLVQARLALQAAGWEVPTGVPEDIIPLF